MSSTNAGRANSTWRKRFQSTLHSYINVRRPGYRDKQQIQETGIDPRGICELLPLDFAFVCGYGVEDEMREAEKAGPYIPRGNR